ncbi:serine/threonine-protein kinase [Parafrankia sp. FMc2]|uniref:serine/threonine-protein kinase n=1 Tax=Parafrankia sp. FMc2 TaxID=3233196 RepID=UPI0034D6FB4E
MRKLGSRYVLHELLGQGTAGQVWRGAHVSDGEPVAIKVLRPELAHDPEVVDRFLRECDLLVQLDSPDLVRVRELIQEPGTLAIVMDLVEGIDLRAHLDQAGPRPVTEAVRLVVGLLWALDSVHGAGIIHRDVKPENVLIDTSDPRRPYVRLTDFGVARMIQTPGRASLTGPIGTPLYMAPELADEVPPTPAVDIYAAGVVLYELIAGSPPFDASHPADLMRAHREDVPQPIQGVPPAVWDVLAAMLAKSPQQRPASAADAAEDLLDAIEDEDRDRDLDEGDDDQRWEREQGRRADPRGTGASRQHGGPGALQGRPGSRDSDFDTAQTRIDRDRATAGAPQRDPARSGTTGRQPAVVGAGALGAGAARTGSAGAAAGATAVLSGGGATGAHGGWADAAHTQVGGIPATQASSPPSGRAGWNDDAHTQVAGIPPVRPDRGGADQTWAGKAPDGWDEADAATGAQPAVRVPARSAGSAADRNTVISRSKDSAPASTVSGPGSPAARSAVDRRRRSRIAAGAGLVVALVAGAGGWALAAGDSESGLTADGQTQTLIDPSITATLPGGLPMPPGMDPAQVGPSGGPSGPARTSPAASPGQSASPGATPTQSGPATASPSATTSPSPTPKDATVPDVQGQSQSAASNTLSGKGFTNVSSSETCQKGKNGGVVLDQNPNAGSVVPVSTRVTLTVQATNCVEVPSVAGSSLEAARSTLVGKGFGVLNGSGNCSYGPGRNAAGTNPAAGTMMRKGESVWLEPSCAASPAPAPPPSSAPPASPASAK